MVFVIMAMVKAGVKAVVVKCGTKRRINTTIRVFVTTVRAGEEARARDGGTDGR